MRTPGGSPRPNTSERVATAVETAVLIGSPQHHSVIVRDSGAGRHRLRIFKFIYQNGARNFALNRDKTLEYRQGWPADSRPAEVTMLVQCWGGQDRSLPDNSPIVHYCGEAIA